MPPEKPRWPFDVNACDLGLDFYAQAAAHKSSMYYQGTTGDTLPCLRRRQIHRLLVLTVDQASLI